MSHTLGRSVRLVIFLADTGAGHRSVAEALREELEGASQREVSVHVIDFFDAFRMPILRRAPFLYALLTRHAVWIYNFLWFITNRPLASQILARVIYFMVGRRLAAYLVRVQPDLVISVHPLYISQVLVRARTKLKRRFNIATVVSDPVTPHASWASTGSEVVFASTEEAARRLTEFGVDSARIRVVGFPVRKAFAETAGFNRDAVKRSLGFNTGPLVVLTGGGVGSGALAAAAESLTQATANLQLLILTGTNRSLHRKLARCQRDRVRTCSFLKDIAPVYAAADVVISKAGPSTIFEVAEVGRPLLLTAEVGRQEKGNIAMAERLGIALDCQDLRLLVKHVEKALTWRFNVQKISTDQRPASKIALLLLRDAVHVHDAEI